jgi:hypothetical protein
MATTLSALKSQRRETWEIDVLTRLSRSGPTGRQAVDYLARRKGMVSFGAQSTGAKWTPKGMLIGPPDIIVSSKQMKATKEGKDAWSISLIAHEAKHYQQGLFVALSVYGELEAWQLQMRVLRELGAPPKHAALLAIEKLKLSHDPKVLREAARLMVEFSPGYRIDLLPLNPIINFRSQ